MKKSKRMNVILLMLALLFAMSANEVFGASSRSNLIYRFTARDFMAAACMNGTTYPSDIDLYWKSQNNPAAITSNPRKIGSTSFCPIRRDIIDGKYSGHPDFEAHSAVFADGCSGTVNSMLRDPTLPNFTRSIGSVSCNSGTNLTRIVENQLEYHEDGIPKMIYCKGPFNPLDPSDERCGWQNNVEVTTTGKFTFDLWYRDNPKWSKRVGFTLNLNVTTPGGTLFEFNADVGAPSGNPKFRPIDNFLSCSAVNQRMDCSNGGKLWPKQVLDAELSFGGTPSYDENAPGNSRYAYTTESHTFFTFAGNEIFTFQGDDDVFVFINEKLAIDVGGLHQIQLGTLNFSNPSVQQGLNLTVGGVYALDVYHAERHSTGSNFRITTSLAPGCNILDAGKPAYSWNLTTISTDWKLIGGPTWGIVSSNSILLVDGSVANIVGYAFLRNQVNVGAGFVVQFSFNATNNGEGFAFVIQRDSIVDLGGGSGGNLGFKNIKNSVAIAFDFCNDRNDPTVSCDLRDIRLHYNNQTGSPNSPSPTTRKLRAILIHPNELNDKATHDVEIRYFDKSPPWLEVYIDNDLFLQKRDFNIESIIGGRNAFIGFTAATGPFAASKSSILINNVEISSIAIEDANSKSVGLPPANVSTALANGRQVVSFQIGTFDFCKNAIEFGGSAIKAKGLLTRVIDDSRRLLQSANSTNITTVDAVVVDLANGFYSLNFSTTQPGNYSLEMWFGSGCFNGTAFVTSNTSTCFYESHANVASFTPVPPEPKPEDDAVTGLPSAVLTGVGVAAGVISFCGLVMVAIGVRVRNQWRKDKEFIEAGRIAAAEKNVQYTGDTDLDSLQNRLQATLHEIQKERARNKGEENKQHIVEGLLRQKGELQEHVRRLKILKAGGDPDAKQVAFGEELGRRVRKSFAATRLSRGLSLRHENPLGINSRDSASIGGGSNRFSTANPLFSFARFSVRRTERPVASTLWAEVVDETETKLPPPPPPTNF